VASRARGLAMHSMQHRLNEVEFAATAAQQAEASKVDPLWVAITAGDLAAVEAIVKSDGTALTRHGGGGETALLWCYLLNGPAQQRIAERLIELRPEVLGDTYSKDVYGGENALHVAIAKGDVALVKFLVRKRHDLLLGRATGSFFRRGDGGMSYLGELPLSFAVSLNRPEIVHYLVVEEGAAIWGCDRYGNNAAHMCVYHDRKDMYLLLDALWSAGLGGASDAAFKGVALANLCNGQLDTPMVMAARLGNKDMFEFLWDQQKRLEWSWGHLDAWLYPMEYIDATAKKVLDLAALAAEAKAARAGMAAAAAAAAAGAAAVVSSTAAGGDGGGGGGAAGAATTTVPTAPLPAAPPAPVMGRRTVSVAHHRLARTIVGGGGGGSGGGDAAPAAGSDGSDGGDEGGGGVTAASLVSDVHLPTTVLDVVVMGNCESILMLDRVLHILTMKWQKFGRAVFMFRLFLTVAFLTVFMLMSVYRSDLPVDRAPLRCPPEADAVTCRRAVTCEALVIAFVVLRGSMDVLRLAHMGLTKFLLEAKGATFLEHAMSSLTWVSIVVGFALDTAAGAATSKVPLSIAAVFGWAQLLWFMLGFRLTGPFVIILYHMMMRDVVNFLVLLAIVMLGFTQTFVFLSVESEDSGLELFAGTLRNLVQLLFQPDLPEPDADNDRFMLLPSIVYCLLAFVLMLNLLVAQFNGTFSTIMASSETRWQLERARIILALERDLPNRLRVAKRMEYWTMWEGQPCLHWEVRNASDNDTPARKEFITAAVAALKASLPHPSPPLLVETLPPVVAAPRPGLHLDPISDAPLVSDSDDSDSDDDGAADGAAAPPSPPPPPPPSPPSVPPLILEREVSDLSAAAVATVNPLVTT